MKKCKFLVKPLFLAVLIGFTLVLPSILHAKQDTLSFVISPPPVGYPEFEVGFTDWIAGGNFIYVRSKVMDTTYQVFGAMFYGNGQYHPTSKLALSGNLGAAFLMGDKYELTITQLPFQLNLAYQLDLSRNLSLFLLGGAGGDLSLTTMKLDIPHLVPATTTIIYDPTTLFTLVTTGKVSAGLQANIGIGSCILSPFGMYTYTAGSYSTEQRTALSYDYPSSSGAIDGYSSTLLGFDLLYKPMGLSLSSITHFKPDTTLVSIALKWLLTRKG